MSLCLHADTVFISSHQCPGDIADGKLRGLFCSHISHQMHVTPMSPAGSRTIYLGSAIYSLRKSWLINQSLRLEVTWETSC